MGSAGEDAAMEAATHQESAGQGSLLNKVYAMQCAQQQQQQQSTILTVVGGRMVSRAAPMPLNGQQLMMQLDGLTSAMTGMSVQNPFLLIDVAESFHQVFACGLHGSDTSEVIVDILVESGGIDLLGVEVLEVFFKYLICSLVSLAKV